jgi:radical SAM superfamily enzyme YgiQ (UPF0313 family)
MKILLISANSLPASPIGPAYIAGALLRAGHQVEPFECLFAQDLMTELRSRIKQFDPDVIGISVRLVHGYIFDETAPYHTRFLDLRANVRQVVEAVRQTTHAPIVLGGPGFNYFARDWLEYLNLDYGICGEADFSFPVFLEQLEKGGDLASVPGCIFRKNGQIHAVPRDQVADLDQTAFPAYELFDLEHYQRQGIAPGILTKRGCAFQCTYCPYRSLEGARYRLKTPSRVVNEIVHIQRLSTSDRIMFCENNFNVPKPHAEAICREILARKLEIHWGTGDLRPMNITEDFCQLMKESGCNYLNLSIESGSKKMLRLMQRGYTLGDACQSLACLEKAGIPFGVSLMIGAPGETPETVAESLALIDRFHIPLGTWVTIGICLWTPLQKVLQEARSAGQLGDDSELFAGSTYLSPELPEKYMRALIETLQSKQGVAVQVNKPFGSYLRTYPD